MPHSLDRLRFLRAALGRVKYFYLIKPISVAVNFVIVAILARQLGTENYGVIALILAITSVVMTALEFRSNEAVVRFFLHSLSTGAKDRARGYLCIGLALDVVLAGTLAIIAYFSSDRLASYFLKDQNQSFALFIYLASGAFLFLGGTTNAVLQSQERFGILNILDLCHKLFRLGWVVSVNLSIMTVMIGFAVSNFLYCLTLAAAAFPTAARLTRRSGLVVEGVMVHEFLSFSVTTFLSSLLKVGQRDIDKLILGIFATSAVVGVYDIIKRIAGLLPWVTFPLDIAAYPAMVRLYRDRRYTDLYERILLCAKIALMVSVGVGLVIFLFFPLIVDIFGIARSDQNRLVLVVLLFSNTLSNTLWFVRPLSNAFGKPWYSVIAGMIMSVSQIVLLFLLATNFGIIGASLANLSATIIAAIAWAKIFTSLAGDWKKVST